MTRHTNRLRSPWTVAASAAFGLLVTPAPAQAAPCADPSGVCLTGAKWEPGGTMDDKARVKDFKKNKKKKDVSLSVIVEGGRASVFIDGTWVAPAPLRGHLLKPGKHDVQIRDQDTIITTGVIVIPKKGGPVTMTVNHP